MNFNSSGGSKCACRSWMQRELSKESPGVLLKVAEASGQDMRAVNLASKFSNLFASYSDRL